MENKSKTIAIASGGTGGHLFPSIEVSKFLEKDRFKTIFILDRRVRNLIKHEDVKIIQSGSPFKKGLYAKVKNILLLIFGCFQSLFILNRFNVNIVIGFGGYCSVPVIFAAWLLRKPIILHEQNAVLGRANRFCLFFTSTIALSYKKTEKIKKNIETFYTGNPVRKEIANVGLEKYKPTNSSNFNILIVGGSQGAKVFSKIIPQAIDLLPKKLKDKVKIFHQVRLEDKDRLKKVYEKINVKFKLNTFFNDIENFYQISHLIISRSGSSSLFEISAAGRPSIIIPLNSSLDDHQTKNAEEMVKNKGAILISEKNLNPKILSEKIKKLINKPKLLSCLATNAKKQFKHNSACLIASLVLKKLDL